MWNDPGEGWTAPVTISSDTISPSLTPIDIPVPVLTFATSYTCPRDGCSPTQSHDFPVPFSVPARELKLSQYPLPSLYVWFVRVLSLIFLTAPFSVVEGSLPSRVRVGQAHFMRRSHGRPRATRRDQVVTENQLGSFSPALPASPTFSTPSTLRKADDQDRLLHEPRLKRHVTTSPSQRRRDGSTGP